MTPSAKAKHAATEHELRTELLMRREIGGQMASACHNLSQYVSANIGQRELEILEILKRKWDAIPRCE